MGIDEYTNSAGIVELLALSTKRLYKLVDDVWTQIPQSPSGDLSGTDTDLFWGVEIANKFVFCQGIDPVMVYDGESGFFQRVSVNCPPAKCGLAHQGRLVIGNTKEGAFYSPYRIRWSILDDITDWTGAGSGYIDLNDTPDFVIWIDQVADYIVVFKERTILIGQRTGLSSPAYSFSQLVGATGTIAPLGVINLGQELVYIGADNIYVVDTIHNRPIGDRIRPQFFSDINPQYQSQIYGYYVDEFEECRWGVPTGPDSYNNQEWCWNVRDNTWTKRPRESKCIGFSSRGSDLTWDTAPGMWEDYSEIPWNSRVVLQNYPTTLIGRSDGQVYEEDDLLKTDVGSTIESIYDFGDIVADPSLNTLLSRVEIRYKDTGSSTNILVGFSTDGGNNWEEVTVPLNSVGEPGKILRTYADKIISAESIGVRIRHNESKDFRIVGVRGWISRMGHNLATS
jgi:hypothetical protein